VAADVLIDRAMVHARAAAYAAQGLADFAAEHRASSGVDEYEVHVPGAVKFAFAPDAGQEVDIVGDRLSGRRARQQAHQGRHVLECRNDLLDAGDRDVDVGQGRRQRCVALVGYQHDRAGLGDEKIAS